MTSLLGQVASYRLLQLLSSKLGSQLFSAHCTVKNREVALKIGPRGTDTIPSAIERERLALDELSSPYIVRLLDSGVHEADMEYIVMEWADGGSLFDRVSASGNFGPESLALAGVFAAAEALRTAHDKGWVHCDFKPHNILCVADAEIRLADWGSARHTAAPVPRTKGWGGSPLFMSPEHLESPPLKPCSDIFSFGLSLHWALTGTFANASPDGLISTLSRTIAGSLTSPRQVVPEVPLWLESLFLRCTEPNPALRIQDGADLCKEIVRSGD